MSPEFSVRDVLAFARSKPADARFAYSDVGNCFCAQFMRSVGLPIHCPQRQRLEEQLANIILDCEYLPGAPGKPGERRFGDVAERLEKLCPETPDYARIEAYLADIEAVEVL